MDHKITVGPEIDRAFEMAKKAQTHSYSPYSKFAVGAAFKFIGDPTLYPGCNVENMSYGATNCAERTAIFSKIANTGFGIIEYAVVLANTDTPTPPCALCLQVMNEFNEKDFPVYLGNPNGLTKKMNFKELLPHGFATLKEGQK